MSNVVPRYWQFTNTIMKTTHTQLIYTSKPIPYYMRIEIDDRSDGSFLVTVDKKGSALNGENICFTTYDVRDMIENILVYDM